MELPGGAPLAVDNVDVHLAEKESEVICLLGREEFASELFGIPPSQPDASHDLHKKRSDPCDKALPENKSHCPFATKLPFDRGDGSNAGRIQQTEY